MKLHVPRDLQQIDLSVLRARIVYIEKLDKYTCVIGNPKYQSIKPLTVRHKERLRILMRHELYKFLLRRKEIKYCECGNLIFDKRDFVDLCEECNNRS